MLFDGFGGLDCDEEQSSHHLGQPAFAKLRLVVDPGFLLLYPWLTCYSWCHLFRPWFSLALRPFSELAAPPHLGVRPFPLLLVSLVSRYTWLIAKLLFYNVIFKFIWNYVLWPVYTVAAFLFGVCIGLAQLVWRGGMSLVSVISEHIPQFAIAIFVFGTLAFLYFAIAKNKSSRLTPLPTTWRVPDYKVLRPKKY